MGHKIKCPWNPEHEVELAEYSKHLETCPDAAKKAPTTLKQLFKGEVLNGYLEAARVKALTEFVEGKKLNFTTQVLDLDAAVTLRNKKLVQTIRSDKEIEGLAERDLVTITLDDREIGKAMITSIDKVRLSELAQDDIERGGFPTLPHLEDALKRAGFRFKPLSEYVENRVRFEWQQETVEPVKIDATWGRSPRGLPAVWVVVYVEGKLKVRGHVEVGRETIESLRTIIRAKLRGAVIDAGLSETQEFSRQLKLTEDLIATAPSEVLPTDILSLEETRILQTHKFAPKKEIYHLTDDKESILKSDRIFTRAGGMLSLTANPKLAHVLPERELKRKFRLVLDFQKLKEDLGIALFPVYYVTEKEWYETKPPSWLIDYYRKTDVTFYQDVEAWNTAPMIYMDVDLFAEESEWKSKTDIFPVKKYLIRVEEVEPPESKITATKEKAKADVEAMLKLPVEEAAFKERMEKGIETYKRKEFPIDEWYILYAPHQKPPYYQFEYKIMGSWDLIRFENFDDLIKLLAKGREELYVHATRMKEIVTWKPITIQNFTLTPGTKEETPAHIYTLIQPMLLSKDPHHWVWRVSIWDKTERTSSEKEMTEEKWKAMWEKAPLQTWIQPMLEVITKKSVEEGWASDEQIHREFEAQGLTHEEVDKVVAQLQREGTIYQPRVGYYRKT